MKRGLPVERKGGSQPVVLQCAAQITARFQMLTHSRQADQTADFHIIETDDRIELVDLTERIMELVRGMSIREGIVSLIGTVPDLDVVGTCSSLPELVESVERHGPDVVLTVADRFERPLGIATSGAFGVEDSAALSSGAFVQHALGGSLLLNASLETAQHRSEASGALTAPDYAVHSASFGIRHSLGAGTTVSADLRRDWSGNDSLSLHVPLTIDENGDIGRVTYTLPYDALVGRTAFSLRLDHQLGRQTTLRAGLTHERNGLGVSVTGLAAVLEFAID